MKFFPIYYRTGYFCTQIESCVQTEKRRPSRRRPHRDNEDEKDPPERFHVAGTGFRAGVVRPREGRIRRRTAARRDRHGHVVARGDDRRPLHRDRNARRGRAPRRRSRDERSGRLRPPANGRPCGSRDHLYMYRYGCGGRRRRAVPLRPTPRDAHPARRSLYADGRVGRTESRGMGRPRLRRPSGGADRPERDRRSGRGALHAGRRRRRAGLRPRIRYAVNRHGRLRRRSARLHDLREPHGLVRSRDGADADPDRRRNRGRGNARVVHATLHGRAGRTTLPLHRQGRIALGARHRMGRPRHLPALRSQRRTRSADRRPRRGRHPRR